MHPVRKLIESTPKGTAFTREGLLEAWEKVQDEGEAPRWVPTSEAHRITGMPESTLRANAPKWQRMHDNDQRPPIRVIRKGTSDRSPWLFDQHDCYGYRRANGGGPRLVERVDPVDDSGYDEVDEHEATARYWEARVTENLG